MGDIELKQSARETLRMSLENVAPLINPKSDFASIKGKIEPTRDLILKLIDPFSLSFDTDLQSTERVGEVTFYTFKATVTGPDGRTVTGWGKCGTDEVSGGERADHDALTKAETRALKRAIEAKAGYGLVNQLIVKFFGGYEEKSEPRNVTPDNGIAAARAEANKAGLACRESKQFTDDEIAAMRKDKERFWNDVVPLQTLAAKWKDELLLRVNTVEKVPFGDKK